jgi:pilus assembly protein CpaE
MTETSPIKVFITGACAGLAEVRQALSSHPDIEIVGTAVEPAKAQDKLAASGAQVVLHGSARGDRLPAPDVDAIRQATAAPLMLVTSGNASGLLSEALSAGVADVVLLPQLTDALVFSIRKTTQLVHQRAISPVASLRASSEGKIITVFSPKGGVGKSVIACGLATQLARKCERRALLLDLDLQFGDAAIMMGIEPEKTIYDLVMTTGELDTEKLAGYVTTHPSGVDLVPAPVRPEDAELVAEERVARLLDVAKESYDAIVVDTPAFFQATTLATLDRTERLLLIASLDIPTVKNVKLTLQTLNLLHYPKDRIHLVLNRAGGKGELKRGEVEKALDLKVSFELPNDREVGVAVNRGVPVPLSAPRCGVSKTLSEMASALITAPGASEGRRGRRRGRGTTEGGGSRRGSVKLRKAA